MKRWFIGNELRARIVWNESHPDDPLRDGEVIHHRNGDTTDDRPENLEKLLSQAEHFSLHARALLPRRRRDHQGRFVNGLHD